MSELDDFVMPAQSIKDIGWDIASGKQPSEADCTVIRASILGRKPMEVAQIFHALAGAGCMDVEVARITGRTRRNVRTLSAVYAQQELRNLVIAGLIPVSLAARAAEDSELTGLPVKATLQAAFVDSTKKARMAGKPWSERRSDQQLSMILSHFPGAPATATSTAASRLSRLAKAEIRRALLRAKATLYPLDAAG